MSLASRERQSLCDLAEEVGPGAPTLCGTWTVRDLLVHLVVRESDPLGAPGIVLPPLAGLTQKRSDRLADVPFADLVAKVRRPARWSPSSVGALDARMNALEMFVHLEDVRRAQPGWASRPLSVQDQDALWGYVRSMGRLMVRSAGVPVLVRRSDTGAEAELRAGADPAVVVGEPSEIVLFLYGREQLHELEVQGPPARVEALRSADLGI